MMSLRPSLLRSLLTVTRSRQVRAKSSSTPRPAQSSSAEELQPRPRSHEEVSEFVREEMKHHHRGFGYVEHDKKADAWHGHMNLFVIVGMFLLPAFFFYYHPDIKHGDWTYREAFLVLRDREARGVIPISRDLVDPAKLELPTEEELGDTEIII